MPTKLAIFDCDGTLMDSQHSIVTSVNRAFESMNLQTPPAEMVRQQVGLSLTEVMLNLLPLEYDTPGRAEKLADEYRKAFRQLRAEGSGPDPLFPGILEMLEALHKEGMLLAVATGKSRRGLVEVLEEHNLKSMFASLATADDAPSKPHPGMLELILAETGQMPADAVFVGDTSYDMQAAFNARIVGLGVTWGYHSQKVLQQSGATAVFSSCRKLKKAISERP